jgi:hypothetical protein
MRFSSSFAALTAAPMINKTMIMTNKNETVKSASSIMNRMNRRSMMSEIPTLPQKDVGRCFDFFDQ